VTSNAVLLDSAVALYAFGGPSSYKASCAEVMRRVATDRLEAYASVEMVQEFVHHRLRRTGDHSMAAADGHDLVAMIKLLDFDAAVLELSLDLIGRLGKVRGRDAVHAATALLYGIGTIISPDPAFDGIGGIVRADPHTVAASSESR
jgi:uncharacterized protein